MIRIQLMAIGSAWNKRLHLRPNVSHIQPTIKVPATPPTPIDAATHAISDDVNEPLANGDWSDSSSRKADEVQPNDVPAPSAHRLAENDNRCMWFGIELRMLSAFKFIHLFTTNDGQVLIDCTALRYEFYYHFVVLLLLLLLFYSSKKIGAILYDISI